MNFLASFTVTWSWLLSVLVAVPTGHAATAPLTKVFYLGDSYLDDGNYKSLTNGAGPEYFSNSPPWSTVLDLALGQPSAGRWSPAGSHSPFGNNYAVSGAGISYSSTPTNTSLHGQVAKLLEDYPHGLPPNSMVIVAIGTNDVRGVIGFGGIWSNSPSEWKIGYTGFTVPEVNASVTVPVTSTVGITPGPMNLVAFPTNTVPTMMAVTQVDPKGNQITLTNKIGAAGTKIPANAGFQVCGKWFLDQALSILAADIKSIVADHGQVLFVLLPPTDILPSYNRKSNQALAHETWKYCYDKMSNLASQDNQRVLTFDLKPIFQEVFSDPVRYGFKVSYPCWLGTGSADPNEYMFWDDAHPTGSMHRYIAQKVLEFIRAKGLTERS